MLQGRRTTWPKSGPMVREIFASAAMAAGRAGTPPDTTRIPASGSSRTYWAEPQAEVKAKLKQAIGEAGSLDVARAGKYTVAEWLRLWFEVYAKPNLRFSTAEYYRRGIELHTIPYIGEVKLNQLTTRQIQNLYRELQQNGRRRAVQKSKRPGLSSSTIRGVHTMLHSALDRAVKEKLLLHNPAEDCVVPKLQRQEMRTLKPEDMRAYLEAAERRGVLALFYLELVSGIRKGELAALLWTDLDAEHGTILVSKQVGRNAQGELAICQPKTSNSVREISIPREAVELLVQEHQRHPESHYLFPSPRTGGMYHPDSIVNLHKKILKDAGLEYIRFHDLRHTFATVALQSGVDVKTVSAMLGHYDAGFTLRTYTHTNRRMQEKAAEKMGEFHGAGAVTPRNRKGRRGQKSSPALSGCFGMWVTVWVGGQTTRLLPPYSLKK